jgi:hypothetical protein
MRFVGSVATSSKVRDQRDFHKMPSPGRKRRDHFGPGLSLESFQVGDELPAALRRQSGPRRHSMPQIPIAQEPLQLAGRRVLHSRRPQVSGSSDSAPVLAVAFGAVLLKKLFPREHGIGLIGVGILPAANFHGRLGNRRDIRLLAPAYLTIRGKRQNASKDGSAQNQEPAH